MTIDLRLTTNQNRIGNFTNSEIHALMAKGKSPNNFGTAANTYILATNMERIIGRSIDTGTDTRSISWSSLMAPYVFEEKLGTNYTYTPHITHLHPEIDYWAGTADGTNEDPERAITDLKNPLTLKSFMQLILPLHCGKTGHEAIIAIRDGFTHNQFDYPKHKDGEKFYWQLVGNACIHNTTHAELIIHMPRQSELPHIKALADGHPSLHWLTYASPEELPYLPDGCPIPSLHTIRFQVPQADKDLLTEAVKKAGAMLIPRDF